jgi:hypothetical protein
MNLETGWWLPSVDQSDRTEFSTEFLRREIGIRIFSGRSEIANQISRVTMGKKALVFTDSSVRNLKSLEIFPKNSVILFILSDETYNLKLNLRALMSSKTYAIIRDYPLGKLGAVLRLPIVLLSKLRRVRKYPSITGSMLKAMASGIYMTSAQLLFRSVSSLTRKRILEMDLGYGLGFCKRYVDFFELNETGSVFEHAIQRNSQDTFESKVRHVFFAGQKGKFDRRLFLSEVNSAGITIDCIHDTYELGGSTENQDKYFEGLRLSRFALCPAGNYSMRTFRYYESLIVGTYPLMERFTLSDPLFHNEMQINWAANSSKVLKLIIGDSNYQMISAEISRIIQQILDNNLQIRRFIATGNTNGIG